MQSKPIKTIGTVAPENLVMMQCTTYDAFKEI